MKKEHMNKKTEKNKKLYTKKQEKLILDNFTSLQIIK